MPDTDEMTITERYKYLRKQQREYRKSNRRRRGELLNEMERITGLERKYLIGLMHGVIKRRARTVQRGCTYGSDFDNALLVIDEAMDYICAERLTPCLPMIAQQLADHGELQLTPKLLGQLAEVSVSTVRRKQRKLRPKRNLWRLPRQRGRQQHNPVLAGVPMEVIAWNVSEPGHFEVDLVHHCGNSSDGDYVHTLQLVDVLTGWSTRVAVLGRSQRAMFDAFERALPQIPFPILELHPDNGSEFFNYHMVRFFKDKVVGVYLSRSRPFHKNDNRFVEQKNSTLVRAYLGDRRLDTVQQPLLLNRLYQKMNLYYNLFQPVLRLTEKCLPDAESSSHRVRRRYAPAATPFDRLCATQTLTVEQRRRLEELRATTNPRALHQEIYALLDQLLSLPGAVPGKPEDVHETLAVPLTIP